MNAILKYFLLPTILFFSGLWQVSAESRQDDVRIASVHSAQILSASHQWGQHLGQVVFANSNHLPFSHSKIVATESEIEDDKWGAEEADSETTNYFSAQFLARPNGYFIHCLKNCLPLCEHFSFSTNYRRNILFQVFRI